VLVCDSWGIGDAPDAQAYGDAGADTLGHVAEAAGGLQVPHLASLGLGHLASMAGVDAEAARGTAHGWGSERSAGKDTTTGHWEMMGICLREPFPLYPEGFPPEVIEPFERAIGTQVLGNVPASGTSIIEELGSEHLASGRPIVYTSGDSVFQVACHRDVVPLEQLYEWCGIARAILTGSHRVGRVIARPFEGSPGGFMRSPERRDFAVPPPAPTVLDGLVAAGIEVRAVGKISDIFDGRGISSSRYADSDDHALDLTIEALREPGRALVFANLVEFDSKYGHRNDPLGYARAIEALDARIPDILGSLSGGVLILTGDHGCDPTIASSTDHTRERTPILVGGLAPEAPARDLGVRSSFGDVGQTAAALLGVRVQTDCGTSFASTLLVNVLAGGSIPGVEDRIRPDDAPSEESNREPCC
jgi:phosphopentomutase